MNTATDTRYFVAVAAREDAPNVVYGIGTTADEALEDAREWADEDTELKAARCSSELYHAVQRKGAPHAGTVTFDSEAGMYALVTELASASLEGAISAYAKATTDAERTQAFDAIQEWIAADEDLLEDADFESAAQDLLQKRGLL